MGNVWWISGPPPAPPPRPSGRGPRNKPLPKLPEEAITQQLQQQTLEQQQQAGNNDSDSDSDDKEQITVSPSQRASLRGMTMESSYETSPTEYEDTSVSYDDTLNNNIAQGMTTSPLENMVPVGE